MNFYVGDVWEPEFFFFTDPKTKAGVDPTSVTVQATAPNGAKSGPAATRVSAGLYKPKIPLTEQGKWHAVATGTGTYEGAKPETITVYPV